jgi:hypothetical protein
MQKALKAQQRYQAAQQTAAAEVVTQKQLGGN